MDRCCRLPSPRGRPGVSARARLPSKGSPTQATKTQLVFQKHHQARPEEAQGGLGAPSRAVVRGGERVGERARERGAPCPNSGAARGESTRVLMRPGQQLCCGAHALAASGVWAGGGLCVAPHASPCVSRRREAVALAGVGWVEGEERAALRESCIHADVGSFGLHARREARDAGWRPGRLGEASGAGSRERGALHSWRERGGGGGGRCAGSLLLQLWPLANEACDGRRPCSERC